MASWEYELETWKETHEWNRNALANAKKELAKAEAEVREAQEAFDQSETKIKQISARIEQENRSLQPAQRRLEAQMLGVPMAVRAYDEMANEDLNRLKQERDKLKPKIEKLEADLTEVAEQHAALGREWSKRKQQIFKDKNDRKERDAAIQKLNEEMKPKSHSLAETYDSLAVQLDTVQDKFSALQQQIDRFG